MLSCVINGNLTNQVRAEENKDLTFKPNLNPTVSKNQEYERVVEKRKKELMKQVPSSGYSKKGSDAWLRKATDKAKKTSVSPPTPALNLALVFCSVPELGFCPALRHSRLRAQDPPWVPTVSPCSSQPLLKLKRPRLSEARCHHLDTGAEWRHPSQRGKNRPGQILNQRYLFDLYIALCHTPPNTS